MKILYIANMFKPHTNHSYLANALEQRGHTIERATAKVVIGDWCIEQNIERYDYFKQFKRFPLSNIIDKFPDFDVIITESSTVLFENDLGGKPLVIYYHKDLYCPIFCTKPDILLYRFTRHPDVCKRTVPEYWKPIKYKRLFFNAANRERFLPIEEKTVKGLNYIGIEREIKMLPYRSSFHYNYYKHNLDIYEYCRKRGILNLCVGKSRGIKYYTAMMPLCETILIIPAWDAHETRRLYEAGLSKTLAVIFIQDDVAEATFRKMGWTHGRTCLTFRNKEELDGISEGLKAGVFNVEFMAGKAYQVAYKFHTYYARAKQIEGIIKEFKKGIEI